MKYPFSQFISALDAANTFPVGLDAAGKKAIFNEALEQVINSGRWNGTEDVLTVKLNSSGEMTLPRHWQTAKGTRVNGFARDMASMWYNYLSGTSDTSQLWSTNIIDQGDGFCTFAQPQGVIIDGITGLSTVENVPVKLRIVCADNTGTAEIHGYDADGAEVYTGTQRGVVLTLNAGKTTPYFNIVKEIIMPVTTKPKYLYACFDDSTETVIGIYEPGEVTANYRRYLVSEASQINPDDLEANELLVQTIAQRRFVPMVADNDIVPIGNLGAMKAAVRSVHWQNESDEDRQQTNFDRAIKLLNDELKRLRPPSEVGAMRVNARYTGGYGLRAMR